VLPTVTIPKVNTGAFDFSPKQAHTIKKRASPPFPHYLTTIDPDWQWDIPHLHYIQQRLGQVTTGDIDRLMIFLPPRHGKSEMTTVRYAAWWLERDPSQRVIIGSYSQTLANKFSRKVRKIADGRGVPIDFARRAVDDWETLKGGGLRAAGVGAGVTGMGGNLIIIDDPIKNREEANSLTYRDKVWTWYTDDLYTRLEPGGRIILIVTRWHEDDLPGRILASEDGPNWTVIKIPAIAEDNDPLGRERGAALWPERYDLDALDSVQVAIGSRAFASLYQQRPVEQEGGMFKRSWFQFIDADNLPKMDATIRAWDKAASAGRGDYSAAVKMGRGVDGNYYVLDVKRGQWSTNERDKVMLQTAKEDGPAVLIEEEEEPGSSGKDVTTYHARMMAGYSFRGQRATGSKETRAGPFAAQVEAGNVYLVRAPWNNAYIDELCMFPNGANDDQVDPSGAGFMRIALRQKLKVF
jgi:predicted phage terminase large subunit-like protein